MRNDKKFLQKIVLPGVDHTVGTMQNARSVIRKPGAGWLKSVRQALGLSMEQVARRMGIKRQPYASIESRELRGAVTVDLLERAAAAMDCELVYFLVPKKQGCSFAELAEAISPEGQSRRATARTMDLEGQGRQTLPAERTE